MTSGLETYQEREINSLKQIIETMREEIITLEADKQYYMDLNLDLAAMLYDAGLLNEDSENAELEAENERLRKKYDIQIALEDTEDGPRWVGRIVQYPDIAVFEPSFTETGEAILDIIETLREEQPEGEQPDRIAELEAEVERLDDLLTRAWRHLDVSAPNDDITEEIYNALKGEQPEGEQP